MKLNFIMNTFPGRITFGISRERWNKDDQFMEIRYHFLVWEFNYSKYNRKWRKQ